MKTQRVPKTLATALMAVSVLLAQQPAMTTAAKPPHPSPPGGQTVERAQKNPSQAKINEIPGSYVVTVRGGHAPKGIAHEVGTAPSVTYTDALNGFAAKLTDTQVAALRRHPHVISVDPDGVVEGDGTEYMDAAGQPWGLDRSDQRSRTLSRTYTWWGVGTGVTAYVIDSGIQTSHPDFGGRAINVFDAFGGNGQDCHGHGTHVAGTIGGARYGVAKNVRLRGVKVLDCTNRGSYSGMIAGVDWVMRNATRPAVANMSISGPFYAPLNAAVTNLTGSGIFVAVAAGNDARDACASSPASAAGTMTVASVDWNDNRASDSNWGPCVDLYAPGVGIQSAGLGGGQAILSGTSMATPHVAGIAALIKGDYGDVASPAMVTYILSYTTNNVVGGNPAGTPNKVVFQAGW